jgi:hypothetical protein
MFNTGVTYIKGVCVQSAEENISTIGEGREMLVIMLAL